MKTIWKFKLLFLRGGCEVPKGAIPIFVGLDPRMIPCVWFEVDPDAPTEKRRCSIVGTGDPIPPNSNHCGSFIESPFVWHVYLLR